MDGQCEQCGCCPCDCHGHAIDHEATFSGQGWAEFEKLDTNIESLIGVVLTRQAENELFRFPASMRNASLEEVEAFLKVA